MTAKTTASCVKAIVDAEDVQRPAEQAEAAERRQQPDAGDRRRQHERQLDRVTTSGVARNDVRRDQIRRRRPDQRGSAPSRSASSRASRAARRRGGVVHRRRAARPAGCRRRSRRSGGGGTRARARRERERRPERRRGLASLRAAREAGVPQRGLASRRRAGRAIERAPRPSGRPLHDRDLVADGRLRRSARNRDQVTSSRPAARRSRRRSPRRPRRARACPIRLHVRLLADGLAQYRRQARAAAAPARVAADRHRRRRDHELDRLRRRSKTEWIFAGFELRHDRATSQFVANVRGLSTRPVRKRLCVLTGRPRRRRRPARRGDLQRELVRAGELEARRRDRELGKTSVSEAAA